MPAEAAPRAIHATAVAIRGLALLIRGPSRAGKSRLACALIARATPADPITLVGDDRILLHHGAGGLVVRPHPRIAGFIERRGLGLVAVPWMPGAVVGGIVYLGRDRVEMLHVEEDGGLAGLPHLDVTEPEDAAARADRVLAWWAVRGAASAPHFAAKADDAFRPCAKD